jgi:hypothetical protein
MSKKPPAMVDFKFSEDTIDETTGEENPNFIYDDDDDRSNGLKLALEDDEDLDDDEPIKIEEKEKPDSDDIFEDMSPKVKKAEARDKVKKPRKPMSEEHKQKLALAREKAMLVRKQKAIENKKMKALDIEEKELLKKQRVKKVQKLKEEVEGDDEPPKETKIINNLTKKDLEDAQLEAIMKYDAMRKEAKKKKKEEQMIEEGKKKMLNNIQRATGNYSYRDGSNRFDGCY